MFSDAAKSTTSVSTHVEWVIDHSQIAIPESAPKDRIQSITSLLESGEVPFHIDSNNLSTLKNWIADALEEEATKTLGAILAFLRQVP